MEIEDIKSIGVIGAGVMGSGIAQVLARTGYHVVLVDISEELLKKALEKIEKGPFGLMRLVEKGKLTEEEVKNIMERIHPTININEVEDCDFIIEAVPENPELKKEIFKKLDSICKEECIFASNTSSILITDLASAVERKEKVIGMHWFNPAPVMKLIEVVRGALTSDETYNLTVRLAEKCGKTPVEAKDTPGFFTTRFILILTNEAVRMFERGIAGIKEIDTMAKLGFGFPMGPFELMDLVGLDTILHISNYIYNETGEEIFKPPITLKKLVLSGYIGNKKIKTGSKGGWYDYYKPEK
ncbi:3-hydroxyacyl-CoA dehydrogenase [Candidatus Geothermarchaeota archaeon]|nr:MAG: 3-hydroxyacyl-CoA dehydrogenase [Candidatus Geothermarchaeota archaeon]